LKWAWQIGSGVPLQNAFHLAHEVKRLSRASLPSDTAELAGYLIGKTVRKTGRNRISGRIVETEAYPPGDSSGHAYGGRTARNQSLFLDKWFAYDVLYERVDLNFVLEGQELNRAPCSGLTDN
jgi:3-methyladenine DNA glycosylase Mpg